MSGDEFARLAYLIILASSIGGWIFIENRGRMGQTVRMLVAWLLIFVGVAAGYGLWQDFNLSGQRSGVVQTGGEALTLKRAPDNHFYLTLHVDGNALRFMVDTGATSIVLSDRDVDRLGIDRRNLAFLGEARTANGTIRTARVTLENVELEGRQIGNLQAWVGDGPLDVSLLGMEFLNRFGSVQITREELILTP